MGIRLHLPFVWLRYNTDIFRARTTCVVPRPSSRFDRRRIGDFNANGGL
jgi:hypothetical protein